MVQPHRATSSLMPMGEGGGGGGHGCGDDGREGGGEGVDHDMPGAEDCGSPSGLFIALFEFLSCLVQDESWKRDSRSSSQVLGAAGNAGMCSMMRAAGAGERAIPVSMQ
jgi:hypothetical protein